MTRSKRKNEPITNSANSVAKQKLPANFKIPETFEELQLMQLKIMINKISGKILDEMHEDKSGTNALLPQLRIYAQYLNLYMKFNDKYLKETEQTNPTQPKAKHADHPKENNQTKQQTKPEPTPIQPQNKIHNRINQPQPTEQIKTNNTTALLMQPMNSS